MHAIEVQLLKSKHGSRYKEWGAFNSGNSDRKSSENVCRDRFLREPGRSQRDS